MEYFAWMAKIAKESPYLHGLMVVVTMSGFGAVLALIADIIVRATGINVGAYKKEYEDESSVIHH